jgi:large subunit ribosomal protein L18e
MRKAKTDNPQLLSLIRFLRKTAKEQNAQIWNHIADTLSKPRRNRPVLNLSRVSRCAGKGDVVAVTGKLLGSGKLAHPVTVAAFEFSAAAEEKVRNAKGKCLSFYDLAKKHPKGSNVRILG